MEEEEQMWLWRRKDNIHMVARDGWTSYNNDGHGFGLNRTEPLSYGLKVYWFQTNLMVWFGLVWFGLDFLKINGSISIWFGLNF